MTPAEVAAQLDGLRDAGRALRQRPFDETLAALARVLDAWSDPGSVWRRELADALPRATGFAPETVREGLDLALAHWNGDALRRLVADELDGPADGFPVTAVLLAGSIPMPSLVSMLAPLALRSPVFAKAASRDPVTPALVARSVAAEDALLGRCVAVGAFPGDDPATDALLAADCVVATGSDETVAAVASRTGGATRLVRHGHRLSVAVLGASATRGDALAGAAAGLARDVALWDQLGCLSPVGVYVVAGDEEAADRVAHALAAALRDAEKRWPRGRVEPQDLARFAHERAEAELRSAAGRAVSVIGGAEQPFCVVREADARPRAAPLHRFVRVMPVPDEASLDGALAPLAAHLAGVALEGFGPRSEVADALRRLGASRVCAPGELQAPPLGWRRDDHGVLASLTKASRR